jgi:hypothetical protein
MNRIYSPTTSLLFFLFVIIANTNSLFASVKKEIDPISIVPMTSSYTLKWKKPVNSAVVVFVSETKIISEPSTFEEINSASEYKKGTGFNDAFAVYKGQEDQALIKGLKAGVQYYVWFYETDAAGRLKNVTDQITLIDPKMIAPKKTELLSQDTDQNLIAPTVAKPGPGNGPTSSAFTLVCAPVSGITCTLSGTTSSGYIGGPAPCNANPFGTVNPWDGGSCSGFIAFSFSTPVKSVIVKMIAVNSVVDKTTITQSGGTGGALTVSSPVCMSFAGLVLGPYTGSGSYGDVSAKVTSAGTYTTLTCTNSGCSSGWVAACPSFISTLPIELISFTAECNMENVVDLNWKTISETNNAFFTVERSANTNDWEILGTIKGAGTSTQTHDYSFTDKQRFGGTMYYRIKQTDLNGDFKYSDLVAARNCKIYAESIEDVSFYPNPASDDITVNSNSDATLLEIYNVLGKIVLQKNLFTGENTLSISDLSNGTYFIKVSDASNASKMTRLVISH